MHQSSFWEMSVFVNKYLNPNDKLKIIDIGSQDINGTYKPLFENNENWEYVGLDLTPGKNVNIVSNEMYSYPIESESFDVVISGQCLEHVQNTHLWIKENARILKKEGIICIITPWTWNEHKCPIDCWRIFPDGMSFLMEDIANLKVIENYINSPNTDCIGIAKKGMIITENLKKLEEQDIITFNEVIKVNTYNVKKEEIKNKTIIDIGANIGLFSIFCAENGAKKVIAIEANSNIFKKLKENTKEYNNIEIINLAVYKEDNIDVYIKDNNTCSTITEDSNCLKIKTITLESIINKFDLQNMEDIVLKLDCEGAEHDILLNTKKEILEKIKTIYIEIHESEVSYDETHNIKKLKKQIEEFGFEIKYNAPEMLCWQINENGEKFNIRKMPTETYKFIKKKVAIIMPAYNCEKTIEKSINAIINQTYKEWTLFVINDCSTDSTEDILNKTSLKEKKIHIIESFKNEGPSASRNLAIEKILKENFNYIAYCDADDIWDNVHLEENIFCLENKCVDMIYSNAKTVFEDGSNASSYGMNISNFFNFNDLCKNNFIYISSVVHKKECLSIGCFDSKLDSIEDWDYWLRICKEGYNIEKNNKQTISYLVKNNSFASKSNDNIYNLFYNKHKDSNLRIRLLSVCKNEEKMLPYFLNYYCKFCEEIIIYDNGSTDESINIINSFPKTKVINYDTNNKLDDIKITEILNNNYKEESENYDWQIICSIDEFIYHQKLIKKLIKYKKEGITIPKITGYQMYSNFFPTENIQIYNIIKKGFRDNNLDKNAIFNPQKVQINYEVGCHICNPAGDIKYSKNNEFKLLHYRFISYDYLQNKNKERIKELSESNKEHGYGIHYKIFSKITKEDFINDCKKCEDIFKELEEETIKKNISKIDDKIVIKTSIIIPTYNHLEDCLKPCIESIIKHTNLNDTEIIIVANGCNDGTEEYVKSLGKPFKLLLFKKPIGYTKAINAGINIAKGEYIVLLNNDSILLEQNKNDWINILIDPLKDPNIGITGPLELYSEEIKKNYLLFFCVAMRRCLFLELGLLDEIFSPGMGEDVDFCLKTENAGYKIQRVPSEKNIFNNDIGFYCGKFPIFHEGGKTFSELEENGNILNKNKKILLKRYSEKNELKIKKNRIYDTFIFYNELDLLELRLNELYKTVYKFVIVESTLTHSGQKKKLYYNENKKRFKKFEEQIIHIIEDISTPFFDSWLRENAQRNAIIKGLQDCNDDDIICISDVDEIPNYKKLLEYNKNLGIVNLEMNLYCYYLNNKNIYQTWHHGKIIPYDLLKKRKKTITDIRMIHETEELLSIKDGGWHFSFIGGINNIINKLNNYAHQEFNNEYYKDYKRIEENIKLGKSILEDKKMFEVEEIGNTYPEYLINNFEKFKNYILLKTNKKGLIKKMKKISIIIPTYKKHLKECIDSILKFTDMSNKEIVIVANGCDEKNSEYIREINNKNFIKTIWFKDPIGYPKAINVGVKESNIESEFLIFLNDDVVLLKQEKDIWINLLCDPLIKDNSLIATGPLKKVLSKDNYLIGIEQLKKEFINEHYLMFFCCAIKKNLFYKVGYLDERFSPGGCEDIDWCLRSIKLGYKLLEVPENENNREDSSEMTYGSFPISHFGAFTMYEINNLNKEILEKNIKLLLKKHVNIYNIYDCFMFNDELDILEIRFDELYETVDKFVLVEATKTHSGKNKPLYFQENKNKYKKYMDKIIHIIVKDLPEDTDNHWIRERTQRDNILKGLVNCKDEDIILSGDVDEIPKKEIVKNYKISDGVIGLDLQYSFYYINCVRQKKGTSHYKIMPYKIAKEHLSALRYEEVPIIKNAGWHFSFIGDVDNIIKKIESYAHQEYNTDYYKNKKKLKKKIENAEDILEKNMEFKYVKIDNSFPDFVIKNEKKLIEKGLIKKIEILKERYKLKNKIFLNERNEEIKYSVIIPTYNHLEDCLKPCLEGIRKYTNLENMEILVVANGCNNETKDYVQSLEKQFILLWSNEKLGYTKATNKGIERAKGKYIILLNNDTEIIGGYKNEWVDRLNEPFNNINEKIGITCSHTLYSPEVEDEFAIFYNVMIPRKIINEIGLLDEIFSPGFGEDIDYCMKIKKHGYTICNVSHNGYPMNHKSGQTFHDKENHENYEKTVKKNQNILYQRYVANKSNEITATIVTKNRYFDTLPLAIESVINQTLKPKKLILYDNGDKIDLRKLPIYQSLFSKLDQKGIQWEVIFIDEPGQIHGHQHAIKNVKTEWIWRLDDDEVAEPNVLETLMKNANNKEIGAIAGLVIDPKNVQTITSSNIENNKINNVELNIQWFLHKEKRTIEVEHLYSSFLFRTKAGKHGYCMELSPACHREETIFTYEMKRNGWKLLVDTNAITWHYRSEQGGIRSYNDSSFWENDEKIFKDKLKNWKIK